MLALLQTDLALVLVVPLCLLAPRIPWAAAVLALPLAGAQLAPAADAMIGARGALDWAGAAVRAGLFAGLPWAFAAALRRQKRETAERSAKTWSGLRAVQLGEFLSFVLYQLREYLITVASITEALALSAPKGEEALAEKLGRLKRVVGELNAKTARLLGDRSAMTTQAPGASKAFDIAALAREAAQDAQAVFGSGHAPISVVQDGALSPVTADARALRASLLAVLQNALEASAARPRSEPVSVVVRQAEDAAQIEVVDDAGGIPAATLQTVFEPFFSARMSSHGLGLGLPMSRRLMERMGGALRVKSKDGRTAVLLELPLRAELPVIRAEESTWAGRRSGV